MPDPFVNSSYEREPRDFYPTPRWVTECLVPHMSLDVGTAIWEPAAGRGDIMDVFHDQQCLVAGTDIYPLRADVEEKDFFKQPLEESRPIDWIVTNPPYDMIDQFVERCLQHMDENECSVAILARHNWVSGKRRSSITDRLAKMIVLRKRPIWFPDRENKASPIHNFNWYIWEPSHFGPPQIFFEG